MNSGMEQHEMVVSKTHPNGAQEWFCPVCGRRLLLQFPPQYERVIFDPGDEAVIHVGGTGGVSLAQPNLEQSADELPQASADREGEHTASDEDLNDPYLLPWAKWLEKIDF